MPGPSGAPGGRALTDDELTHLVMPPVPSLAHDAAWFADVDRAKPHAAVLRRLRSRWRRARPYRTARNASLVSQLAPAAATSRRIAWSFVTTTIARSTGVAATSARITSSAITPGLE